MYLWILTETCEISIKKLRGKRKDEELGSGAYLLKNNDIFITFYAYIPEEAKKIEL